jgi:hypothetical protein
VVCRLVLHYGEENPDEVVAAPDDKTEACSASSKPGAWRCAVRCAVGGIVPRPTYAPQDLKGVALRLNTGQVASVERPTLAFMLRGDAKSRPWFHGMAELRGKSTR